MKSSDLSKSDKNDAWKIFIPQNFYLTTEWGGDKKQEQWAKLSLLALQRCDAWLINQIYPPSLQDIYYFLASERMKIARVLGHKIVYGMHRYEEIFSPFSKDRTRTKGQYDEIKQRFLNMPKNEEGDVEYNILIDNEKKRIVRLRFEIDREILYVDYPPIEITKILMEEANKIWINLLNQKAALQLKDEDIYFNLGKILWYLAIARPLEFGSASVSEYLYYTLRHQLKLPLVTLNLGNKTWDIWAMYHETPEEYASWFRDMAMKSQSHNPHFTLPPLDMQDNTSSIENEANEIFIKFKFLDESDYTEQEREYFLNEFFSNTAAFKTTNLVDPYGLTLFHHYILVICKRTLEIDHHLIEVRERFNKAYQMMSNAQVLFIEALLNVPNNFDPVIFMMGTFEKVTNNDTFELLLKHTNLGFIIDEIYNQIMLFYNDAKDEIKYKVLLSFFNYIILLCHSHPEIVSLAGALKEKVELRTNENLFKLFHESNEEIILLFNMIKDENLYTNAQLIKLIELVHYPQVADFFQNLNVEAWLTPRIDEKSFLDYILENKNSNLLTLPFDQAINDEKTLEQLMDYVVARQNYQNLTFFFIKLFNYVGKISLSILSERIKPWLDQHTGVNLIPLIFNDELHIPLETALPMLFPDIEQIKIMSSCKNKSAIECALRIHNLNNRIAAVEFIAEKITDCSIPLEHFDNELINKIWNYLIHSKNFDVCRKLCSQFNPQIIQKMSSNLINVLSYKEGTADKSIINFCMILNDFANSRAEYEPTLFIRSISLHELLSQQIISNLKAAYKYHYQNSDAGPLVLYFKHLNFLSQEDLQDCKQFFNKLNSVVTIIDEKIETQRLNIK